MFGMFSCEIGCNGGRVFGIVLMERSREFEDGDEGIIK